MDMNLYFQDESCLRTEDILKIIEEQGDSIALIMFSGNKKHKLINPITIMIEMFAYFFWQCQEVENLLEMSTQ